MSHPLTWGLMRSVTGSQDRQDDRKHWALNCSADKPPQVGTISSYVRLCKNTCSGKTLQFIAKPRECRPWRDPALRADSDSLEFGTISPWRKEIFWHQIHGLSMGPTRLWRAPHPGMRTKAPSLQTGEGTQRYWTRALMLSKVANCLWWCMPSLLETASSFRLGRERGPSCLAKNARGDSHFTVRNAATEEARTRPGCHVLRVEKQGFREVRGGPLIFRTHTCRQIA